jgi:subtilisin family serine protease
MRSSCFRAWTAVACAAALAACSDHAQSPTGLLSPDDPALASAMAEAVRDVPRLAMDRPPAPRSWDTDDAALVSAIRDADGYVGIAFREQGSPRALETGVRAGVSAGAIRGGLQMLRARGVQVERYLSSTGVALARIDPELGPWLRAHPNVDYVEPSATRDLMAQTYGWGAMMVAGTPIWRHWTRGYGAKVLVIDSGHQLGHDDLPVVPTSNCGGAYNVGCSAGTNTHGMHVLGIIAARDNSIGVVGVANGIAGSNVYTWGACTNGSCNTSEAVAGLNQAVTWGIKVVNMSYGGPNYNATEANAIAAAWAADIVLVAAAGNNGLNGTVVYPAGYTNVIGVSGVKDDRNFADWSPCVNSLGTRAVSNYGSHVDIAAPMWATSTVLNDQYVQNCGTSMAAPHVTGAAALVRSLFPSWSAAKVTQRLLSSAQDRGTAGWDQYYGYGIVNASAAIAGDYSVGIDGPLYLFQPGMYTWTAQLSTYDLGTYSIGWYTREYAGGPVSTDSWGEVAGGPTYDRYADYCGDDFDLQVRVKSELRGVAMNETFVDHFISGGMCW